MNISTFLQDKNSRD